MIQVRGIYRIEHWRKGIRLGVYHLPNGIVNVGKTAMLDSLFNDGVYGSDWFIGFIDNADFIEVDHDDNINGHPGWLEWVDIELATRVPWEKDPASSNQVTNPTPYTVALSASGALQGIFVVNDGTLNGTIGLLWSTAIFNTPLIVNNEDELIISYLVTAGTDPAWVEDGGFP